MQKRTLMPTVLVLIGISIAAVPFIDGYLFKKNYLDMVTAMNTGVNNNTGGVNVVVEDYRLGWLSSHAKLRLVIADKEVSSAFPEGLVIEDDISHGPFAFDSSLNKRVLAFATSVGHFYFPPKIQMVVFGKTTNQPSFETQTRIGFDNVWSQTVKIPTITIAGVGTLSIKDSSSTTTFSVSNNEADKLNISGVIGAITFQGDKSNLQVPDLIIQPINFQQKSTRQANGLWDSINELSIPNVTLKWADGNNDVVNNLSINTQRGTNAAKLYDGKLTITMQSLNMTNFPISVITTIAPVKFTGGLSNLDPKGLLEYWDFIKSHQASVMSNEDVSKMRMLILKILTPTTQFNSEFSLTTNQGNLTISSKVFNQTPPTATSSVEELFMNASSETNLRISAPFLKQLAVFYAEKQTKEKAAMSAKEDSQTNELQQAVSELLLQGKISLAESMQILELANNHTNVGDFSTKVTEMKPDIAPTLIQAYQVVVQNQNASPVAKQPANANLSVDEIAQKMIDSWVAEGSLVKENNDYVAMIVTKGTMVTINGKITNPATLLTPPATTETTTTSAMPNTAPATAMPNTAPATAMPNTAPATAMPNTAPATAMPNTAPATAMPNTAPATAMPNTAPATAMPNTAPATAMPNTAPATTGNSNEPDALSDANKDVDDVMKSVDDTVTQAQDENPNLTNQEPGQESTQEEAEQPASQ